MREGCRKNANGLRTRHSGVGRHHQPGRRFALRSGPEECHLRCGDLKAFSAQDASLESSFPRKRESLLLFRIPLGDDKAKAETRAIPAFAGMTSEKGSSGVSIPRDHASLAETIFMHPLDPCSIDGTIEADDRINTAKWANSCLARRVAVAPIGNAGWWEFRKAVIAGGDLTGEQLLPVPG